MTGSLDLILPFIRSLEPFILDPTVTEIMVNRGGREVFIERGGQTEETDATVSAKGLENAIKRIARDTQQEVDERQPRLEARLEDGSRVAALLQACSVDGCTMTIRKFGQRYSLEAMVAKGSLPAAVATFLAAAVVDRRNILISGSTGSGKTSLLNALGNTIPLRHRILLIEDTSEIAIDKSHKNLVRFESKEKQLTMGAEEAAVAVTIDDLLRHALRHRPDRIILGEVRGAEAWSLLQALNTGHRGSLSTIHANSAAEALTRLAHCVLMSDIKLPYPSIREAMALAIQLVVHLDKPDDGDRHVAQVLEVQGYDMQHDTFITEPLYQVRRPALNPHANRNLQPTPDDDTCHV